MLDAYRRRLKNSGGNMANALKKQSSTIMDATFKNSTTYKSVIINNENVDARYYAHKTFSINGDDVDYLLQFRPSIKYPIGTYVSIHSDIDSEYADWIIVDKSDDVMFPKYNILKCNYNLKWIDNNEIKEYPSVLRSINRGNVVGVWSNDYMTVLDSIISIWLPSNEDTYCIKHQTRFLISNNPVKPVSYMVTKVEDALVQGIIKVTLKQDELSVYDNTELMIADYYKVFPKDNFVSGLYTYQIVGVDSITIGSKATYKVNAFYNGEPTDVATVNYTIVDGNEEPTDLVDYNVRENNIDITAKDRRGNIKIKAEIDGTIIYKTIKVKGLL